MKKRGMKYVVWMAGIMLLSSACNQGDEHTGQNTEEEHHHTETTVENNHDLTLDDGKKWQANTETTTGAKNMQQIIAKYSGEGNLPLTQLGDDLQKELNLIFDKCNMEGDAHDQLHNFLLPLIDMVDAIKGQEVSASQLKELQEHLDLYFEYFK